MGHFHLYCVTHIDRRLLKVQLLSCYGIDDGTPLEAWPTAQRQSTLARKEIACTVRNRLQFRKFAVCSSTVPVPGRT